MKIAHENKMHNKCDSCEKSFSRAGHLKKHYNVVHNGQKDYKCDLCEKSFAQAGSLETY